MHLKQCIECNYIVIESIVNISKVYCKSLCLFYSRIGVYMFLLYNVDMAVPTIFSIMVLLFM